MKEIVNVYSNLIFRIGIIIVIISTLFLFTNLTTDFYDTPKFLVLIIFTLLLLILLTIKFTFSGKVTFIRTPLDLPLLILLVAGIVSTLLSPSPYLSLLGNQARIHGSLVSLVIYILFYFLLVNSIKSLKDVRWILILTLGVSGILSIISLAVYFGVKILPNPWVHGANFTSTGSTFSTAAVLAMLLPIVLIQIFSQRRVLVKVLCAVLILLFGLFIALAGSWPLYVAALVGLGAVFLFVRPNLRSFNTLLFAVPIIIVAFVLLLSFTPPIGGSAQNPFYEKAQIFPRELQLPVTLSWKISVSAFRDSPLWGSGPSTYLFDFTAYKPIEFNQTKLWNLRFDNAFNEYLGVLATLGGMGLFALLSVTAVFLSSAYRALISNRQQTENSALLTSLAISGLVFFVVLALHSSTLVVWIIGLLMLALFSATIFVLEHDRGETPILDGGGLKQILERFAFFPQGTQQTVAIDALPSILLVVVIVLTLTSFFFGSKFVLADYHHRLALNAVSQNQGVLAYNELIVAEKLNPQNDLYRTDLAQTNLALATAIALAKGPTEASPDGSLTDQDKQNIQILLQQSINEGRVATTLSPKSTVNWEILAGLYRQISGVAQNALVFALDSYGRAIFLDPLNPILRLNVGGTYYAIKSYDLAIRFFTDSINLKPDFANGYYNLSVALRDKGDLPAALTTAQKVLELVDKDSQDFKIVTDYLNDLKSKAAPTSQETNLTAPTSQDKGALQQKELPKVVDVGQPPEKIATPEAIKKPSPTPESTKTP